MNNKGQAGIVLGVAISLIILVGIVWVSIGGIHVITTQDGSHTGYITAVEQNGLVFRTWSVYVKTDPQASQEDQYCITDSNLISQLQNYQDSRTLVTVTYYNYLIRGAEYCKSNDEAIVNGVQNATK